MRVALGITSFHCKESDYKNVVTGFPVHCAQVNFELIAQPWVNKGSTWTACLESTAEACEVRQCCFSVVYHPGQEVHSSHSLSLQSFRLDRVGTDVTEGSWNIQIMLLLCLKPDFRPSPFPCLYVMLSGPAFTSMGFGWAYQRFWHDDLCNIPVREGYDVHFTGTTEAQRGFRWNSAHLTVTIKKIEIQSKLFTWTSRVWWLLPTLDIYSGISHIFEVSLSIHWLLTAPEQSQTWCTRSGEINSAVNATAWEEPCCMWDLSAGFLNSFSLWSFLSAALTSAQCCIWLWPFNSL